MEDKSLELRIAAIEDKLSKLGVSQADILAYQKVASVASQLHASGLRGLQSSLGPG